MGSKLLVCLVILAAHSIYGQIAPQIPTLSECIVRNEDTPCPDKDINFILYSGDSHDSRKVDITDSAWLKNGSNFNSDLPTVLLIHGFSRENGMEVLRDEYIRRGTHNVILVQWTAFTQLHCYVQAVSTVRAVSKCTGRLLHFLEESGVDTTNVTCVGHSLGAHVCGVTANYVPKPISRIVGLDPARPLMQLRADPDRLDAKDAKVVQVIHTSAGYYGMPNMVGSVDFCINNGIQPYCQRSITPVLCSHFQSICYFADSLDPARVRTGTPCARSCPQLLLESNKPGDTARVGEFMDSSADGMFCLTSAEAPFCSRNAPADNPNYGDSRCCP